MGIVDGFKPVFFNTQDRTQLEQFIFGNVGDHIEFGAQQCWSPVIGIEISCANRGLLYTGIIVRNEAARREAPATSRRSWSCAVRVLFWLPRY